MSRLAVLLVLASCFTHAGWNLYTKHTARTAAYLWWANIAVLGVCAAPFLAFSARDLPSVQVAVWVCVAITGVFQSAYFAALSAAYGRGDASLVYPLARISPVLVVPLSGFLQGRWPAPGALLGIVIVCGGCLLLTAPRRRGDPGASDLTVAILLALGAALASAGYTVTDDIGIQDLHVRMAGPRAAFLYAYLEYVSTTVYLGGTLWMTGELRSLRPSWQGARGSAVTVGVLIFVTYLLVLWAYGESSHVAYVAGLRQFSVVLGVLGGIVLFKEPRRRLLAAAVICAGLVLLVLAR